MCVRVRVRVRAYMYVCVYVCRPTYVCVCAYPMYITLSTILVSTFIIHGP
jgi:hypothetical protein